MDETKKIIIYIIINLFMLSNNNIIIYCYSNITLKIKGIGKHSIFKLNKGKYLFNSNHFPDEEYINGKRINISHEYYFNKAENDVLLIWNNKIDNCGRMFYGCVNITEIDLSHFDSSQVIKIDAMFYNCVSLSSLNLSNFNTSQVTNMGHLFYNCSSLTSLDLSYFNTSQVKYIDNMFNNCQSLTLLNLSNFNTSQVQYTYNMFYNCKNLEYINLINFSSDSLSLNSSYYSNMFVNISKNAVICIKDDENNDRITKQIDNKGCYIIDCSNNWKLNRKKLIIKNNSCIDNCYKDSEYKYEYNGKCYNNCSYYYYVDKENNFKCTNNNSCPTEYNKLIPKKNMCIKNCSEDDIFKYEYLNKCFLNNSETICTKEKPFQIIETTECVKNCGINDIINNYCILNFKDEINKVQDKFYENLKIDFTSEHFNTSNLDEGIEIIMKNDKMIVTLTTSDIQKNNSNNNMTSIDLNNCENELRKYYNISNNNKLYIMKIDIEQTGYKIPKVEYDLYSKLNNSNLIKLNKLICSNINIDMYVPYKITESIDILNSSSGYYNDICYTTISDSGTDISLKDRMEEYINNNKTVCQDDCDFSEYIDEIQEVKCTCKVKESFSLFDDMIIDRKKLLKNFAKVQNIANMKIMICYKKLFTKEGIIHNIGCFIMIPISLFHIISIFIFYIKQKNKLKRKIENIANNIINNNLSERKESGKSQIKARKKKKRNYKNKKKKNSSNNINIENSEDNNKNKKSNNPPRKKISRKKKKNIIFNDNIINCINICDNVQINNKKRRTLAETQLNDENNIVNIKSKEQKLIKKHNNKKEYTDEEINELNYDLAIKYDKRTYIMYYISLLRTKHHFIFSFFNNNDYNSKIIKYDLFFINFSIYYAVNAPFFNDDLMHKIYESNGSFDFIYNLPQIIYTSLISSALNTLLRLLSLSSKDIIKFKNINIKFNQNIKQKENDLKFKLKVKFMLFFIIGFILLLFFWYYLSIFSVIFKNTQIYLIKDTLISYALSLFYPFLIYLIPGLFRIPALAKPKKKNIYLYKVSKFLQIF